MTAIKPVEIQPLTKEEKEKQQGNQGKHATAAELDADPNFPKEWKKRTAKIVEAVDKGFKYMRRQFAGKTYLVLRKGNHDVGLGAYSDEKETKIFEYFPSLQEMSGAPRPSPTGASTAGEEGNPRIRSYLSAPINRAAIIPRDYIPSINVIRYFQVLKENGFPGDFSQFVNEIITRHFAVCNGIRLPVLLEEELTALRGEGEEEKLAETNPD